MFRARPISTLAAIMLSQTKKGPREPADAIQIVLAALSDEQRSRVEAALNQANTQAGAESVTFEFISISGRGIQILEQAAEADVVLFGLEEEVLPGEASHIVAAYPGVKVIGVDADGLVRVVHGAVSEPLSRDLPTVIRWITRRSEPRNASQSRTHEQVAD